MLLSKKILLSFVLICILTFLFTIKTSASSLKTGFLGFDGSTVLLEGEDNVTSIDWYDVGGKGLQSIDKVDSLSLCKQGNTWTYYQTIRSNASYNKKTGVLTPAYQEYPKPELSTFNEDYYWSYDYFYHSGYLTINANPGDSLSFEVDFDGEKDIEASYYFQTEAEYPYVSCTLYYEGDLVHTDTYLETIGSKGNGKYIANFTFEKSGTYYLVSYGYKEVTTTDVNVEQEYRSRTAQVGGPAIKNVKYSKVEKFEQIIDQTTKTLNRTSGKYICRVTWDDGISTKSFFSPLLNLDGEEKANSNAGAVIGAILGSISLIIILGYITTYYLWKKKDVKILHFLIPSYRFVNERIYKDSLNDIEKKEEKKDIEEIKKEKEITTIEEGLSK